MKKLLLLGVLFFATLGVSAQEKGDVEVGARFGVNFANVRGGGGTTDFTSGISFAGIVEYKLSEEWGLKGKLIYDAKGWGNGFFDDGFNAITTDFSLNYLTIPVTANYYFGSDLNWYAGFGLYAGFLLDAQVDTTGVDVKEAFESVDFGYALELGYKFYVDEKTKLFFELEAQGGLSNLFTPVAGVSIKSSRSTISFGAMFDL